MPAADSADIRLQHASPTLPVRAFSILCALSLQPGADLAVQSLVCAGMCSVCMCTVYAVPVCVPMLTHVLHTLNRLCSS